MTKHLFVLGTILAVAGAGCAQETPQTPKAMPASAPPERTMMPAADYQLPDGFPTDFPRYGNAKVISALHDEKADLMSLTSDDEPAVILAWYGQAITHMGFDQKETATANGMTSQNFVNGEYKYTVNVQDQSPTTPRSLISVRRDKITPQ